MVVLEGLLISIIISAPYLWYKIRQHRQEKRELEWFHNLPLSEQDKIVTREITSDELLKEKIKYYYHEKENLK